MKRTLLALALIALPVFGQSTATEGDYTLSVPEQSDHWILVSEPKDSWMIYRDRVHKSTVTSQTVGNSSLFVSLENAGAAKYLPGAAVKKIYSEDSTYASTRVELANGCIGWVQTELLEPTAEKTAKITAQEAKEQEAEKREIKALDAKKFPPHFAGDDIKLVASHFPSPQSEFETTEHFEERLAAFAAQQKPHVFVINPEDDAAFVYNADDHVFNQTFNFHRVVVRTESIITGHHIASNAFNAHVVVRDGSYTQWHLDGSTEDTPSEFRPLTIDMPASQAREVKPYLRIAIECIIKASPVHPGISDDKWTHDATITEPNQTTFHDFGLDVKYLHIFVFDVRTGHTFHIER